MKNNRINKIRKAIVWCLVIGASALVVSCVDQFEYELPDSNSQEDTIGPSADFSYALSADDFTQVKFTNLSFEATTYLWDFGGGNTSTEKDPTFTFAAG